MDIYGILENGIYLQGRHGDADRENGLVDTVHGVTKSRTGLKRLSIHARTHLVNTNNLRQTGMYLDHNLCYNRNAFAKPPLGHVFIFKNFRSWL